MLVDNLIGVGMVLIQELVGVLVLSAGVRMSVAI